MFRTIGVGERLGLPALCEAILDGHMLRLHAAGNLGAWHGDYLRLLAAELGVGWSDDWDTFAAAWRPPVRDAAPRVVPDRAPGITAAMLVPDAQGVVPLVEAIAALRPPYVLRSLPRVYTGLVAPLDGMMEYGCTRAETKVMDAHLPGIAAATRELRSSWQRYLGDLLLIRWPEAAGRETTLAVLQSQGLGEQPDEMDYF